MQLEHDEHMIEQTAPEGTRASAQQCPLPGASLENGFLFSHQKLICLKVSRPN